jgi:hypothetical protein
MAAERQRRGKKAAWRSGKESALRSDEEATLRSYLLGLASAEERERVEQQLLTDPGYFDELQRMEECLIDEFVRGEIKGVEKAQFDSHFLKSAEHQEELEFARLLDRYFSRQDDFLGQNDLQNVSPLPVPKWRAVLEVVLASALILLMAGTSSLLKKSTRLSKEGMAAEGRERYLSQQLVEQQQAVKEQQQIVNSLRQQLAEQQIRASLSGGDARDIISISLNPGLARTGVNIRQVTIPASAQVLRLNLKLRGISYPRYRAAAETVDGVVVWNADGLKARPHTSSKDRVVLMIPTKLIIHSQYLIKLTGISKAGTAETVDTYYMEIDKR